MAAPTLKPEYGTYALSLTFQAALMRGARSFFSLFSDISIDFSEVAEAELASVQAVGDVVIYENFLFPKTGLETF